MSLALLFTGQGAQHPGMLGWVDGCPAARPALEGLAARLGADWRARLAAPGWAEANAIAQPLVTGLGLAAWLALAPLLPQPPAVVAGYSVGELAAFCAAGVTGLEATLALAQARAAAMDACVAPGATGLLSVGSLDDAALAPLLARHRGLAVAIVLGADKRVLGGEVEALEAAAVELAAVGANCRRLPIALASHTPWMQPAARRFARALDAVPFAAPRALLVTDRTGTALRREAELRAALAEQIAAPVQWARALETIAERRPRCVLELGPGRALAALWSEVHPEVPARSADEFRSAEAVAEWVRRQGG